MLQASWTNNLLLRIQKRIEDEIRILTHPVVEISGIRLPMSRKLSRSVRRLFYRGSYEKAELKIIESQLRQEDVVMEIGAGIGLISTFCAKRVGSARVFAYEANPMMKAYIEKTYQLNNVSPTLEICLLGEQEGTQTFYVDRNFCSSSTIQRNSDVKAIEVSVRSFNQEIKRINPSFLIIDIEGGEYDLIQFADLKDVQKICIELHERIIGFEKIDIIKTTLTQAGFQENKALSDGEQLFLERVAS